MTGWYLFVSGIYTVSGVNNTVVSTMCCISVCSAHAF